MPKTTKNTGIVCIRFLLACLPLLIASLVIAGPVAALPVAPSDAHDIVVSYTRNDLHEVSSRLEHKGVVVVINNINDEEDTGPQRLALEVRADIQFKQRFSGTAKDLQAIRKYGETKAEFKIDKGSKTSELNSDRNLILARIKPDARERFQLACVTDYLSQSDLELIQNPCDPLTFPALFSKSGVSVDDEWTVENNVIADFLAVDRVYHNEIRVILKSVENNQAKVYVTGSVKADVDDVQTLIEVSAIALIDLESHDVVSIRTNLREQRDAGQIAAGFDGETKIELTMKRQAEIAELSNEALARVTSKQVDRHLKWESEPGRFSVIYDTRWKMIVAEEDAAIMRFVDNGNLLAQCNIVRLPARPVGNPLTLDAFKAEVEKMVGHEESARVIDAESKKTKNDLSALRVTVQGTEEDVPVQWIYYHLEAEDGRRMTFVFTMEQEIASSFVPADKLLVNELAFQPKLPRAEKPAAAKGETAEPRTGENSTSSRTKR